LPENCIVARFTFVFNEFLNYSFNCIHFGAVNIEAAILGGLPPFSAGEGRTATKPNWSSIFQILSLPGFMSWESSRIVFSTLEILVALKIQDVLREYCIMSICEGQVP